jgi:4-amino-4-deoxy-L-arabinose transferase-like glycosyltransferase
MANQQKTNRASLTGAGGVAAAMPPRIVAAALCLAVAVIHIKDQGGFPGDKQPTYVGIGYYILELAAVAAAALLLSRSYRKGWLLSIGVALGPFIGYALSRGPGMPSYTDDRGNWTETIGVISLLVEGVLLLLALAASLRPEAAAAD